MKDDEREGDYHDLYGVPKHDGDCVTPKEDDEPVMTFLPDVEVTDQAAWDAKMRELGA